MSWRTVLITAVIAILLAGYGLLTHRKEDELTITPAPAQPGYYLHEAIVTETDASGAARLKLHASRIAQNPADNSIELQQVTLDYQSDPNARWLLTANRGHLAAGSHTINFFGAVNIKPQNQTDNQIELRTETLSVDTLNNIATAPGKVSIDMDQQRLTAVGLKYDLKRQTLQLESRLHGQFQAQ
ncbi:MAG: LPS export ABC transporter periplasmic protein LptC [Steroidobacteraceae bacterium]